MDTGVPMDEVVMAYITDQLGGVVTAAAYGETRGRIHLVERPAQGGQPMWYDEAVKTVTQAGIMTGTGNGFEPEATVTRATVFQTLYNLEGKPETANRMAIWPDAQGTWYEPAARWAQQVGLTEGTGDGFQGDRAITRAEIVTILERYAEMKGLDVAVESATDVLAYDDAEDVAPWAVPAFQWAVDKGVVSGKTADNGPLLAPNDTATRAELAQILTNCLDFFPKAAQ